MILVFTGDGKGKSSAALGTIVRALGWGKRVVLVRFFKGWWETGEEVFFDKLQKENPRFKMKSFPVKEWVKARNPKADKAFDSAFEYTKDLIGRKKRKPFLVIADEVLIGLKLGICEDTDIIKLIDLANKNRVHLVLTGRGWPETLNKHADLVTEMREVKHPYSSQKKKAKGVKGLDY